MNSKQVQGKRKLMKVKYQDIVPEIKDLDGVEGASLGSKFKHMKPGSKKKETIIKKQESLPIKKYVPKKQEPLPIKKYVPKKQEPLPIKEYVPKKQEPLPIKEYVPKKQEPLPIKKYVPKKQEPLQMKDVLMTKESNSKQNESEVSGEEDCCKGSIKVGNVFRGENRKKYKVLGNLVMADYSEIWRVEDISTKKRFVLKFVNIKVHDVLTRVEIDVLKMVQNCAREGEENYIVNLIDTCEAWKDKCCHRLLILEELGDSLLKIIEGDKPQLQYVKQIVKQILLGLVFLHTRCKYIHADIKPENVLLRPKYRGGDKGDVNQKLIKIIDVGTARKSQSSYESEIQTREYRAPEVLTGELGERKFNLTEKVDIWSVGCVLYELITGEYLFYSNEDTDENHKAEIEKFIGQPPGSFCKRILSKSSLNLTAAIELSKFLQFVLVWDPAHRPSAEECLKHKFFDSVNN